MGQIYFPYDNQSRKLVFQVIYKGVRMHAINDWTSAHKLWNKYETPFLLHGFEEEKLQVIIKDG